MTICFAALRGGERGGDFGACVSFVGCAADDDDDDDDDDEDEDEEEGGDEAARAASAAFGVCGTAKVDLPATGLAWSVTSITSMSASTSILLLLLPAMLLLLLLLLLLLVSFVGGT